MSREPHPLWTPVRTILFREWDPIGVSRMGDWPEDEYDSYIWPLISLVMRGGSEMEVADYLDWASNVSMECPQPRETNLGFARRLIALREMPPS